MCLHFRLFGIENNHPNHCNRSIMAAAEVQSPMESVATEPTPGVPDYLASPNAVFNDVGVKWRYGKAPDYSKTRKVWEEGQRSPAGIVARSSPPLPPRSPHYLY